MRRPSSPERAVLVVLALWCVGAPAWTPAGTPAATPPKGELPLVEGSSYVGVIFPAERAEGLAADFYVKDATYWTPAPADVEKFEARLRAALEAGAGSPESLGVDRQGSQHARDYVSGEIGKILMHLGEYRRQYIGIVTKDGSRRIAVNFFNAERDSTWRYGFVMVLDGGFWYWHIQYDVATGKYLGFSSNGYA